MKLYNTLTKRIDDFIPKNGKEVTLYTCGPTVYSYAHIGNLRTYVFEDVLEKSLNYLGYNVKRIMNITDVGHLTGDGDDGEDKMIVTMRKEGKTALEIADFYTAAFKNDCEKLNINWPRTAKATDHISKYIEIISKLLEDGFAYESNGNVYFDISKAKDYHRLLGKKEEDLKIGVRNDVKLDENKRNPFDFVLWFTNSKFSEQELQWDSPFGRGYPGWHIECSSIANEYFGENLDIHCGGVDNIFPHHTNEIAQSEAYSGHNWCDYWVHGEFLNDATGKMSKSKGDYLTLSLLESKGYNPLDYRYFCLSSHYRKQLVFTYESLDVAKVSLSKLKNKISVLKNDGEIKKTEYIGRFKENLNNDLNISNVLTLVYDVLKDTAINESTKLYLIEEFDKVLSLDLLKAELISSEEQEYIDIKLQEREEAKKNKEYDKADNIRDELLEKGFIIKDTREGIKVGKKV